MPKPKLHASGFLCRLVRSESGRLLSILLNHTNDIQLAEDVLQEALIQAMEIWPKEGQPNNPQAWLLTVARRKLIDRFRRNSHQNNDKTIQAIRDCLYEDNNETESDHPIPDERLKLIFTCCHPSLTKDAQVALTLKTLCGLTSREIARAYLVSEVAMNQRLTRAKQKIKKAGIAYQIPDTDQLPDRLPAVLSVIYLIFNESYTAFEGQSLSRQDLADEAIRLAKVVYQLLPHPEVAGLWCLMVLHNARRHARTNSSHQLIPLEEQNRQLWVHEEIKDARSQLLKVLASNQPGSYQIQAAISALHAEAKNWEDTDWAQIIYLYDALYQLNPSPVVKLNQQVAIAHSGRYREAMEYLKTLEKDLEHYQPFYAARAAIAAALNNVDLAITDYDKAIGLSQNNAQRDFLISRKNLLLQ